MPEKNIGLEDNFFEIGTTSLALSQIHEKIDERFPDRLEITDYADYPSIQELAVFLSQPPEEA
ncbi:MAG: acyl carrier protein, partial [Bacteroidota bacterium]